MADVDVDLLLEPGDLGARTRGRARPSASRSSATPIASIRASTGMSGSSISRNSRSSLDLGEPPLERLADRDRRERLEARRGPSPAARSAGGRIWSRFSATTSAMVWLAQRGVEDVRRDLRVERDPARHRRPGPRRSAATRSGLTSCPTSGVPSRSRQVAQRIGRLGAVGRDDPTVGARRPRARAACRGAAAGRRAAATTPTAGWAASHGSRSAIRSAPRTSIRPGSTMAAARAVGRSAAGSNDRSDRAGAVRGPSRRGPSPAAAAAATASKSSRSWSSPLCGPAAVARPGPQPSGRPATRAAGT